MTASEKWQASGLSDEQAARLELQELSEELTSTLAPNLLRVRSLLLPYHDKAGARTEFYRVRYLGDLPGWAGLAEKPQRYAQPAGSVNRAYFPRLIDWAAVAVQPEVPLYITEGELKAAAATARGFPTIGLGGVDVWRAQRRGLGLLLDLEDVAWNARRVHVVFDSDAHQNPNVVRAQLQLAAALTQAGANVSFVALPQGKNGDKQGLDDFLAVHSVDEFQALVAEATPFEEGRALHALNERALVVLSPGVIYERGTGEMMSRDRFTRLNYADQKFNQVTTRADGSPSIKVKPLADHWLEWTGRAQVSRLTYRPGEPEYTDGMLNLWKGWGVLPCEGSVELWLQLQSHLFQGAEPGAREWFEQWVAYPLQHPGVKLYTAALLWGTARGTGKTLIGYTLARIYGANAKEIKSNDLHSDFNDWAKNKQFIIGDEVTGSERRQDADRLKGLITQERVTINEKYVPKFELPDCMNFYFTSQHPDAFFIEEEERRYFVHQVVVPPLSMEFYNAYDAWYRSEAVGALFKYLLSLDTSGFNPRAPAFKTAAALNMAADTRSDLGAWVDELADNPGAVLGRAGAAGQADIYTPRQLCEVHNVQGDSRAVTAGRVGRELRRRGFEQRIVMAGGGAQRLWAVRNREKWRKASPLEWAKHFEQFQSAPQEVKF